VAPNQELEFSLKPEGAQARMSCAKEAVGAGETNEGIAIARHHFETALSLLTTANATEAEPEPRHLLLAG
jgi:hypothetical protein